MDAQFDMSYRMDALLDNRNRERFTTSLMRDRPALLWSGMFGIQPRGRKKFNKACRALDSVCRVQNDAGGIFVVAGAASLEAWRDAAMHTCLAMHETVQVERHLVPPGSRAQP